MHATLLAMWISERNAEKWRANIGAPIGACHETTPCVGRNQEVPVEQIIIFIGSVTHGPSSIVWRHVTIGLKCIGMVSSIRVQLVHAIIPGKTSFLNVQAMKSNKWAWILKGTILEFTWVKEVGLSVWLMTTAEFGKFESSRVIEFEQWWTYTAVIIVFLVTKSYKLHCSCMDRWSKESVSTNRKRIVILFVKQQIDSMLSYVCFKKRSQMTSKVLSIKNRHTRRDGVWTGDWFLVIYKYIKNPNNVIGADVCASFF